MLRTTRPGSFRPTTTWSSRQRCGPTVCPRPTETADRGSSKTDAKPSMTRARARFPTSKAVTAPSWIGGCTRTPPRWCRWWSRARGTRSRITPSTRSPMRTCGQGVSTPRPDWSTWTPTAPKRRCVSPTSRVLPGNGFSMQRTSASHSTAFGPTTTGWSTSGAVIPAGASYRWVWCRCGTRSWPRSRSEPTQPVGCAPSRSPRCRATSDCRRSMTQADSGTRCFVPATRPER